MERVRAKYNALYAQVSKGVKHAHPELDANLKLFFTQREAAGNIRFARKGWLELEGETDDPPCLMMSCLRLDWLGDELQSPPSALVTIPARFAKKLGKKPSDLGSQLFARARTLLKPDEFDRHVDTDETDGADVYFHTKSGREILDLINPDEGKGLVEAIVEQFNVMAKLIPAVDEIFGIEPYSK
jgi:hypothetical protein